MSTPQRFDPPEAVVGPAFTELMSRLARSRVRNPNEMGMSDEERKIFDYGVSERKRVLEHTLVLVFSQWAIYRQVVSRLQSRFLRISYGTGAFLSATYFLGARARRVSHEMFATIATTATNSPLGNEARVVLAELEGPDGPYFRKICSEKGFNEDLGSVIAALDAKEGRDPTADNLHPQLRLRPRLPVGFVHGRGDQGMAGLHGRRGRGDGPIGKEVEVDTRDTVARRKGGDARDVAGWRRENGLGDIGARDTDRMGRETMGKWGGGVTRRTEVDALEGARGRPNGEILVRSNKGKDSAYERSVGESWEEGTEDGLGGKPFDFARAARGAWDSENGDDWAEKENGGGNRFGWEEEDSVERALTPGQKRAAERRRRRMKARGMMKDDLEES
eukprot:GFKZ01014438.1.p1 GENE.GFKZ01014438.1~~GFKZ01014438.1.p1  ORF type:complete len:390 (-),score=60.30 GFKZ01014438.1:747-1916(-)